MKRVIFSIILTLIYVSISSPATNAQPINNCRLEAPGSFGTSLGFPRLTERLVGIKNPKLLVIPFRLKDEPKFSLSQYDKDVFTQSAQDIKKLSRGQSDISFKFNSTVDVEITASELESMGDDTKANNNIPREFNNSTSGFVNRVIQGNDQYINYSEIDAVVLVGNSQKINRSLQIAFPKMRNNPANVDKIWTEPIATAEKDIYNAVLLYNHLEHTTLTHEIGHLFGLADIYGSPASIPFSLMNAQAIDLFAYEQWVLGWLPDSSVTCINEFSELSQNPADNKFSINYMSGDKLIIIPTGKSSAIVIDSIHYTDGILDQNILFFYSLNNLIFPAIQSFDSSSKLSAVTVLNNFGGVGKVTVSPNFNLLITDNDGTNVEFYLIPTSQINSEYSIQLVKTANLKKLEIESRIKALNEEKAAADLKAKVSEELNTKQDSKAQVNKLKKSSIFCVKGKLTKKITAIKPKCPAGYKVKK